VTDAAAARIAATWFDGRQARGQPVQVWLDGAVLHLQDELGHAHTLAAAGVQWPERTRHGQRLAHLPGGGSLAFADAPAFDRWRRAHGHRESWVVRAQQRWQATLAAVAALVLVATAGYVWGLPFAAARVVAALPPAAEAGIGDAALAQLRGSLLQPTQTPPAVQQAWREQLDAALAVAYAPADRAHYTLHFAAGGRLGPNALALPGGHIVVTDELLALLAGADDAVLGVLAHEHGHVRRRHGLQALVRFTLLSAATTVALGDFSAVLAGVPALLGHLGYSRDAEREADVDAAHVLHASGRDPAAMTVLFERLAASPARGGTSDDGTETARGMPIAFASHPADAERVRFFRSYKGKGSGP
jgi:predicted Zn-dependent protease